MTYYKSRASVLVVPHLGIRGKKKTACVRSTLLIPGDEMKVTIEFK